MPEQQAISGIPSEEEEQKANWKMDTENSFARLVITPLHTVSDDGETDLIDVDEAIEIKPFAAPWGFGGMWGHGRYKREEEKKVLAEFHRLADPWVERGLERFEILRESRQTEHVETEAQRETRISRIRMGSREKPDQAALF